MASLHKDPRGKSPFWYAAYRGADGRQKFKSTKKTLRSEALELCLAWERAEREAAQGVLTEARAREIISETVRRVTGKPIHFKTSREWFTEWLNRKIQNNELTETTRIAYQHAVKIFLECLGAKADLNLAAVTGDDVQSFKSTRINSGLAAKTIDRDLKVVRSGFKVARIDGLIGFDPSLAIPFLLKKSKRKSQMVSREIFTVQELDDLISAVSGEWKTAILLARYTGARLGDCVRMSWENVNFQKELISYSDQKTGKEYSIPIHPRLEKHLLELASTDNPKGMLCPTLSIKKTGGNTGLSNEFRRLMARVEIDDRSVKTKSVKEAKGRNRQFARRSFHSIRHTYNSELANAGTSQEVRRKLVGHSSDDMNDVYTHLDEKMFREAINKLS